MSCSGRCELKGSGSAQSVVALEPGASSSFVLPAMHSLGQLRQLLLEVDTSGKQVGGKVHLQQHVLVICTLHPCRKHSMQTPLCIMRDTGCVDPRMACICPCQVAYRNRVSFACVSLMSAHTTCIKRRCLSFCSAADLCVQAVAWRCQHVEVTDTSSGETWLFPCNAWLGSSTGTAAGAAAPLQQCESSKLLLPSSSLNGLLRQLHEEQELEKREQYKVAVYTSSHSPAQGELHRKTLHAEGNTTSRPQASPPLLSRYAVQLRFSRMQVVAAAPCFLQDMWAPWC